jgi:hypothetical protein
MTHLDEWKKKMAVRLFMSSGAERTIDTADSARLDDAFFVVTRRHPETGRLDTVLTLRSTGVVAAEVLEDGVRTHYVLGRGQTSK